MSRKKAIICDNCGKQIINSEEPLFTGELTRYKKNCLLGIGYNIFNGDYCNKCIYEIMKKEVEEYEQNCIGK